MNNKFRNEILIEGYLFDSDIDNKIFRVQCEDDVIEFRFNDEFHIGVLENLKGNEIIRIRGSFDCDGNGIFLLAKGILVMPEIERRDN